MEFEPDAPNSERSERTVPTSTGKERLGEHGNGRDPYFDLAGFAAEVYRSRWLILCVSVIGLMLAGVHVLFGAKWYRSQVVLSPAEENTSLPALGQLGGLVGLTGISLDSAGMAEAMAVLRSHAFAVSFIEDNRILPDLLDQKRSSWTERLAGVLTGPPDDDLRDAAEFFDSRVLRIVEDARTGLITVMIDWRDPEISAIWANGLVARLNDKMRERALNEAQANIEYLSRELGSTSIVSLQDSLSRLLETEMQKLMVARGTNEFAFRIIDPAFAAKDHVRPRASLWLPVGLTTGLFVSILIVSVRKYLVPFLRAL